MKAKTILIIFLLSLATISLSSCAHVVGDADDPYPLHTAAVHYPENIVEIISGGYPIDSLDDSNQTALQEAATFNRSGSINILLASGANPNAGDSKQAPISIAARNGNVDAVTKLLEHGANPNGVALSTSALHNASIYGYDEIVQLLVDCNGIDINYREPFTGYTALHYAVQHDHPNVITILLEAGIDFDIKSEVGNTALFLADEKSNKAMATLIREFQRDKNKL